MSYKEKDIVHENRKAWVLEDKKRDCYTVFRIGLVGSESDSSYSHDADGLSIAKARCDFFAKPRPL